MIIIFETDTKRAGLLKKWMDTIAPSTVVSSYEMLSANDNITGILVNLHLTTEEQLNELRDNFSDTLIVGFCGTLTEKIEKCSKINKIDVIEKPITQKKIVEAFSTLPPPDVVILTPQFLLEHLINTITCDTPHLARFYDNYSNIIAESCRYLHLKKDRVNILHALAIIHASQLKQDEEKEADTDFSRELSKAFINCMPVCFGSNQSIDERTLDCIEGLAKKNRGDRLESELIITLYDFHMMKEAGSSDGDIILSFNSRPDTYSEKIVKVLKIILGDSAKTVIRKIYPLGLQEGMQLGEDLFIKVDGKQQKLAPEGYIIDKKTLHYIQNQSDKLVNITKPISILERIE